MDCQFSVHCARPLILSHLPLAHQLALQVVDLQEGAAAAEGTYWPDSSHWPAGWMRQLGHIVFLLHSVLPKPAAHVVAADRIGLVHAIV